MIRLDSLTGLRAILAGMVLVVHSFHRVGWLDDSEILKGTIGAFGHLGVVGFFVLSGLILTLVYENRSWTVKRFTINRIARIYPLYILGIVIALPIDWLSPGFNQVGKVEALGLSLISAQSWLEFSNARFNGPGWTISVEFFFYAMFPLLFFFRQKSKIILYILGVVALFVTAFYWDTNSFYVYFRFPLMRIWEFILGMLAADWIFKIRKLPSRPWVPSVILIISAPFIGFYMGHYTNWDFSKWLWMAFSSCLAIVLLAAGDYKHLTCRPLASKWWLFGGEISFGVYLLHDSVQRYSKVGLERILCNSLEEVGVAVKLTYILVTIAVSVALAVMAYKWIECPGRNYIRKKLTPSI